MADRHRLVLTWRDGSEEALAASDDETILEAAESAGASLPLGCRTGACVSCVGRLVHGDVSYERPPRALRDRHREAGYVLCCVARPRSDCQIAVGSSVRSDVVSNPWK